MGERFRERDLRIDGLTLDPIGHLNATGHHEAAAVLAPILNDLITARNSQQWSNAQWIAPFR